MKRTRSYRRNKVKKYKHIAHSRIKDWYIKEKDMPRMVGIYARTPKPCSCVGCGNFRKIEGKTLQELKELQ